MMPLLDGQAVSYKYAFATFSQGMLCIVIALVVGNGLCLTSLDKQDMSAKILLSALQHLLLLRLQGVLLMHSPLKLS